MKAFSLNITSRHSQGLLNDTTVLENALRDIVGKNVRIRHFDGPQKSIGNILRLSALLLEKFLLRKKQITFHLEDVYTVISAVSDTNVLIPNQEWLKETTEAALGRVSSIWCKTHYGQSRLVSLSKELHYLGFASRDLKMPQVTKDFEQYLHIAGKSTHKGTKPLLETWKKNPHWPTLTVLSRIPEHLSYASSNIKIISAFLEEQALQTLINKCGVHVCPSETEGFGHVLTEAMSAGSVVVSTDAPPMNDILLSDKRFLVAYHKTTEHYYSECYHVCEADLLEKLTNIVDMPLTELETIGAASRVKFDETNLQFTRNLRKHLHSII